jgi:hypothetical protein
VTLTPNEIDLILTALHESAEDREQFDEPEQAAAFAVLRSASQAPAAGASTVKTPASVAAMAFAESVNFHSVGSPTIAGTPGA